MEQNPTSEQNAAGNLWEDAWCAFTHPWRFSGCAARREFWGYVLFAACLAYGMELVWSVCQTAGLDVQMVPTVAGRILPALGAWVLLALLAAAVRRLHDTQHSGWWLLAPAATTALSIYTGCLFEGTIKSVDGPNEMLCLLTYTGLFVTFLFCIYILVQLVMPSWHVPNGARPRK